VREEDAMSMHPAGRFPTTSASTAVHAPEQRPAGLVDDLHVAGPETGVREFACLSCVTHLRPGDDRVLRRIAGVTGVLADDDAADLQLIVAATSRRAAVHEIVERVAAALPHAVVTVPQVVDYDASLLCHLELQGCDFDDSWAVFDDCTAVAAVLDRG
jgi:hypothetical protein